MHSRGWLKSPAPSRSLRACFRRSESSSCRRRPASRLILSASSSGAWIPACAGMTETGVDFKSTNSKPPRLRAEGCLVAHLAQSDALKSGSSKRASSPRPSFQRRSQGSGRRAVKGPRNSSERESVSSHQRSTLKRLERFATGTNWLAFRQRPTIRFLALQQFKSAI